MLPSELPMNQTPARLKSSSLRYQLPTGRSVTRSEGKLTNQMGSTKRRGFEETDQRSEEVHVPQLGHAGLSKGEHGPDDLQCREEVGCSWDQWPGSGRMLTIGA